MPNCVCGVNSSANWKASSADRKASSENQVASSEDAEGFFRRNGRLLVQMQKELNFTVTSIYIASYVLIQLRGTQLGDSESIKVCSRKNWVLEGEWLM